MSRTFLVACGVTACLAWTPQTAHTSASQQSSSAAAQAAAIDPALVSRFIAASESDRLNMIGADPALASPAFRQALSSLGVTLRTNGKFAEAAQAFLAQLFLGEQVKNTVTQITALLGLGAVEGTRSNFAKSDGYLQAALDLSIATNYLPGQQQALNNQGTVKRRRGEIDQAMDSMRRSLAIARTMNDPLAIARVLNNLGIAYNDIGDAARAIESYSASLELKERNNAPVAEVVNTLSNIGGVYARQGDYPLAIDFYQRALTKLTNSNNTDAITSVYNNLGQMYLSTYEYDMARTFIARGLALAERIDDPARTATALYLMGTLDRAEDKADAAEARQRRALALREQIEDRLGLIESLTEIASLLAKRAAYPDALPYAERAEALAIDSRLMNEMWMSQLVVGQIHAALGHDALARAAYERAIDNIEQMRQLAAGGQRGQQDFLAERLGPYYGLAALDARAGRTFDALASIDRARGRALVDILTTARMPDERMSPDERDKEQQLTKAVIAAANDLEAEAMADGRDSARFAVLEAALAKARTVRDAFLSGTFAARPDLGLARGHTPEMTRDRLASVLTPGTAIVTFVLDDAVAWIYVATNSATGPVVTVERSPMTPTQLLALSDRFSKQIAARDLAFAPTARQLYDALFGKVDARLQSARQIVVIPDGPLWKVPFQALRTPRGRHLIEERAVSYSPSITALSELERRRRSRASTQPFLVALGDPAVRTVAAAPGAAAQRGAAIVRLPEAAREVRALGRLYGAAHSSVLVDTDATETALRTLVSRASVLHVATHGVLNDRYPMYSHLLLAPGGADTARAADDHLADGRLEAWELLDMGITADIAVFSACQTARGGVRFGEGVIGLSWSLFAAGASTAVVSQWEVDSANTTNLMIAFHQRLLNAGATPSTAPEALRQAAITLLKNPASRHPFYWAGFITVGAK